MDLTQIYVNAQLNKAQQLLWDGSLNSSDEAHNIITKLINDMQDRKNSVGE